MLHLISNFQNAGKRFTQIVTNMLILGVSSRAKLSMCVLCAKAFWEISKMFQIRIWTSDEEQTVGKISGPFFEQRMHTKYVLRSCVLMHFFKKIKSVGDVSSPI